ncbi:MAG: NUDIX hydrolase [Thermodesulfobacteriota bacterium]
MRYCPECAGVFESRPGRGPEAPAGLVCSRCGLVWHPDPKVACAGLLVRNGAVLLVRRARYPQKGLWCLPGGFVDRGETMERAAVREFFEETGLQVQVKHLFGLYSYEGYPIVVGIYLVEPLNLGALEPKPGAECLEVRWFTLEDLPFSTLAFPSTVDSLKALSARTAGYPGLFRRARGWFFPPKPI